MRRVLHIVDALDDSGAGNQPCVLARGLAREGFDVQIATLDAPRIPPCGEGLGESSSGPSAISITSLGRRWAIDPLAFLKLRRLIQRFQPEIVHAWNLDAAIYAGAASSALRP